MRPPMRSAAAIEALRPASKTAPNTRSETGAQRAYALATVLMSLTATPPKLTLDVLAAVAAGRARSQRLEPAGSGDRTRFVPVRHFCRRDCALDESAAEHARLTLSGIVEHTGLARRYSVLA